MKNSKSKLLVSRCEFNQRESSIYRILDHFGYHLDNQEKATAMSHGGRVRMDDGQVVYLNGERETS